MTENVKRTNRKFIGLFYAPTNVNLLAEKRKPPAFLFFCRSNFFFNFIIFIPNLRHISRLRPMYQNCYVPRLNQRDVRLLSLLLFDVHSSSRMRYLVSLNIIYSL